MPDVMQAAAIVLLVIPLVGLVPVANPDLIRIWTASRETQLATVRAHRRGWAILNAGFVVATVSTTAGLAILAVVATGDARPWLMTAAVAYAVGGALWCAVLSIRTATTPTLADLVAQHAAMQPAEDLLGAATGGLFGGYALLTAVSLVILGLAMVAAGTVAPLAASLVTLAGVAFVAWFVLTSDVIPAVLYAPTMLIGAALLAGW